MLVRWLFGLTIAGLYVLHQDWWNWRETHPLVFGFLPIGLAYHAVFTLATMVLMAAAVKWLWPKHLE